MEVENINLVGLQFLQGALQGPPEDGFLMVTRSAGIPFGCQRQTPLLPFRLSSKGFLFAIQVRPGSIDFIKPLLPEIAPNCIQPSVRPSAI